jgi:hypothetical protein
MSDYLAVAGVSAVMKWMLNDALTTNGPSAILTSGAGITATAPDLIQTGAEEQPQLNLFMYYASLNPAFRNAGLPALDSTGQRVSNPVLPLNLHYLVSAYGKNDFDAEILLAWAMQVFHQNPVLTQEDILGYLQEIQQSHSPPPEVTLLLNTSLATQVEMIKITPASLSNDEISRLWMAFQTHYRPTTAYEVSVVLIRAQSTVKSNLPVQSRHLNVLASPAPIIDKVSPASVAPGGQLTIAGRYFVADSASNTLVQFDGGTPVSPATVQNGWVRVTPSALAAGVHSVSIRRQVSFGVSTDPHNGFSSNPVQFILTPQITSSPASGAVNTTVAIGVNPPVQWQQRAALIVGNYSIPLAPSVPGNPASTLNFPIPPDFPYSTPAVSLPLRLEIDGAQSPLTVDTTQGSPTFGQFLPQMTISGP